MATGQQDSQLTVVANPVPGSAPWSALVRLPWGRTLYLASPTNVIIFDDRWLPAAPAGASAISVAKHIDEHTPVPVGHSFDLLVEAVQLLQTVAALL
jgi:hypothetical protein